MGEEDEQEDEDLEEELTTISVLKDFDPYVRFLSTFNGRYKIKSWIFAGDMLSKTHKNCCSSAKKKKKNAPESYNVLTSSFNGEVQSHLIDVLSIGEAHTLGSA